MRIRSLVVEGEKIQFLPLKSEKDHRRNRNYAVVVDNEPMGIWSLIWIPTRDTPIGVYPTH